MAKWRVGSKVPLNVYLDDKAMFQCHTPEDAAVVVELLNDAQKLAPMLGIARELAESLAQVHLAFPRDVEIRHAAFTKARAAGLIPAKEGK